MHYRKTALISRQRRSSRGTDDKSLARIERNEVCRPRIGTLDAIACAAGAAQTTVDSLITRSGRYRVQIKTAPQSVSRRWNSDGTDGPVLYTSIARTSCVFAT